MTTFLVIVAGTSWIGGKSFEALDLGGSSSSQCRGMAMTLLAVDIKSFLYFLSQSWLLQRTSMMDNGSFFRNGFFHWDGFMRFLLTSISQDGSRCLRVFLLLTSVFDCLWLWCLPSSEGMVTQALYLQN